MRKKHKDAVTNVTKKVLKACAMTTKAEGDWVTSEILEDILNDLPKVKEKPKTKVEINYLRDKKTKESPKTAIEKTDPNNDEKENINENMADPGVIDLTSDNKSQPKKSVDPDEEFLSQTNTDLGLLLESAEAHLSLEECPTCKTTLEFNETLEMHMKNEHSEKQPSESTTQICPTCGDYFASPDKMHEHSLAKHVPNFSTHTEKREFARNEDGIRECARCDKSFIWLVDLVRHMTKEHEQFKIREDREDPMDPMYYLLGELMSEIGEEAATIREENGKFQTNILRQLSFQTQNLKQDILNQIQKFDNKGQDQTERPHKPGDTIYVCEVCGFEANSKALLKKHIHCADCGSSFSKREQLNKHITLYHAEDIKISCDIKDCKDIMKQKNTEIKRLNELLKENEKMIKDAMNDSENIKDQSKIKENNSDKLLQEMLEM